MRDNLEPTRELIMAQTVPEVVTQRHRTHRIDGADGPEGDQDRGATVKPDDNGQHARNDCPHDADERDNEGGPNVAPILGVGRPSCIGPFAHRSIPRWASPRTPSTDEEGHTQVNSATTRHNGSVADEHQKTIGIVLFDDVEELDAVGPWEVLAFWCQYFPDDNYTVTTASRSGDSVRCAKGLRIIPDHSFASLPALDVLIYPGGQGTRAQLVDEETLAWVRDQRARVSLMTSVCTGSLVYAAAGLLAGRPATSHWGSLELLAELDPTIEVRDSERFVDDGDIITAAGVSAGIDMALHLVVRLAGADRARQVRRGIQYDPQPPV